MEKININDIASNQILVKALLIENDYEFEERENKIIAKFSDKSIMTIEFKDRNILKRILGNVSL